MLRSTLIGGLGAVLLATTASASIRPDAAAGQLVLPKAETGAQTAMFDKVMKPRAPLPRPNGSRKGK
jgi:hypothetical protein